MPETDQCDREKVMVMCSVRMAGRRDRALGIAKGAKGKGASRDGMGDLITDWLPLLSVLPFCRYLLGLIYMQLLA